MILNVSYPIRRLDTQISTSTKIIIITFGLLVGINLTTDKGSHRIELLWKVNKITCEECLAQVFNKLTIFIRILMPNS